MCRRQLGVAVALTALTPRRTFLSRRGVGAFGAGFARRAPFAVLAAATLTAFAAFTAAAATTFAVPVSAALTTERYFAGRGDGLRPSNGEELLLAAT